MNLVKIKKAFFDRDKVSKALDKKTKKVFTRYGSLTRRIAQQSMRPKKYGVYAPEGTPPYSHGPKLLRKFILFYYDPDTKRCIVGAVLFTRPKSREQMVPRTMEVGGRITAIVRGKQVTKDYGPRPYMKPAHDIAVRKVVPGFKGKL